jgi:hypothetical protein
MKETRRFSRREEDFVCENCGARVSGSGYTDHCPECLFSRHVDNNPGDRKSSCRGMMEPTNAVMERGYFIIYYRCLKCGMEKRVKAAQNDNEELLQMFSDMNMRE